MIRKIAVVLLGGLALVMAAPAVAAAATPGNVDGFWTSVDTDGSNQVVLISQLPGGQFRSVLFDDYASVCGGGPALGRGSGTLAGDTLTVTFRIRCFNGADADPAEVDYVYDEESGTLTDNFGVEWNHVFG